MQHPSERRDAEEMTDVQEEARRIAADAHGLKQRSEPAATTGERPELVPQAPPALDLRGSDAVHHAERVRAGDDVETAERQEDVATGQEEAAEVLRRNAEELHASRFELQSVEERIAENTERVEEVAEGTERLGEQIARLRERIRNATPPGSGDPAS